MGIKWATIGANSDNPLIFYCIKNDVFSLYLNRKIIAKSRAVVMEKG